MTALRFIRRLLWTAAALAAATGATIYLARHATPETTARTVLPPSARDYGPAPALKVQGIAPDALKGRKFLLTFFASWCAPCRIEHPVLMKLSKSVPAGTILWGVDMMDSDDGLAQFLKRDGNPFTAIGTDPSGTAGIDWGVDGIPATFIVGTDGHLIYRHFGPVDQTEADSVILPILRAK